MRKFLLSVLCILMLAGCSAKTSVGNDLMFKIGNDTFTKQETYEAMLNKDGGNTLLDMAMQYVCDKEITESVEDEALKLVESYKADMGVTTNEELAEYVKTYGYASYDEFYDFCEFVTQLDVLVKKYVNENIDEFSKNYYPVVAVQINLEGDNVDKANEIVEALKTKELAEVVEEYALTAQPATTFIAGLGTSEELTNVLKDESDVVLYNGNTVFYKMAKGVETLKDDFVTELTKNSTIITEAYNHYLKKYNLTFHDSDLKKLLENNFAALIN